jgi:hypothetical protein
MWSSNGFLSDRCLCSALIASTCVMAVAVADAGEFGTRCQRTFENGWLPTLDYQYDRCNGFDNRMDDNNSKLFRFSLNNAAGFNGSDGSTSAGGVDTVDIFYVATHGGTSDTDARLALKPAQMFTLSPSWRFGDNSNQIAIFSQYVCETLKIDDKAFGR